MYFYSFIFCSSIQSGYLVNNFYYTSRLEESELQSFIAQYGLKKNSKVTESLKKHLTKWPPPRTKHYHADGARELISQEIQKIREDTKPTVGFSFTSPYSPIKIRIQKDYGVL